MYKTIADRFYWKTMWRYIQTYLQECETCQRTNDAKIEKSSPLLRPIPVKSKVWNQVCPGTAIIVQTNAGELT